MEMNNQTSNAAQTSSPQEIDSTVPNATDLAKEKYSETITEKEPDQLHLLDSELSNPTSQESQLVKRQCIDYSGLFSRCEKLYGAPEQSHVSTEELSIIRQCTHTRLIQDKSDSYNSNIKAWYFINAWTQGAVMQFFEDRKKKTKSSQQNLEKYQIEYGSKQHIQRLSNEKIDDDLNPPCEIYYSPFASQVQVSDENLTIVMLIQQYHLYGKHSEHVVKKMNKVDRVPRDCQSQVHKFTGFRATYTCKIAKDLSGEWKTNPIVRDVSFKRSFEKLETWDFDVNPKDLPHTHYESFIQLNGEIFSQTISEFSVDPGQGQQTQKQHAVQHEKTNQDKHSHLNQPSDTSEQKNSNQDPDNQDQFSHQSQNKDDAAPEDKNESLVESSEKGGESQLLQDNDKNVKEETKEFSSGSKKMVHKSDKIIQKKKVYASDLSSNLKQDEDYDSGQLRSGKLFKGTQSNKTSNQAVQAPTQHSQAHGSKQTTAQKPQKRVQK